MNTDGMDQEVLANEIAKFDWKCRRIGCDSRRWWVKLDDPSFIICSRCRWWIDRRRGPRSKTAQRFVRLEIITPKEIRKTRKGGTRGEIIRARLPKEAMDRIRLAKNQYDLSMSKVLAQSVLNSVDEDGNWTLAGG